MAMAVYRVLVAVLPLQCVSMMAFAWFATRPPQVVTAPVAVRAGVVDRVLVIKSEHRMTLYSHEKVVAVYQVALGRAAGAKQREGDNRTPEGLYFVDGHNAHSEAHMALHLSYPNAQDRARAAAAHVKPGGDVEIHGLPNGLGYMNAFAHASDWTYGCIAVSDPEIEQIFKLVANGTPVEIRP